jgi:hypothetical protein
MRRQATGDGGARDLRLTETRNDGCPSGEETIGSASFNAWKNTGQAGWAIPPVAHIQAQMPLLCEAAV